MSGTQTSAQPVPSAPPAPPPASLPRRLLYVAASLTLGITQGLNSNLVAANIQAAQAWFGATLNEAMWLNSAYVATSITATLLLFKFRTQYGLRRFAEIGLVLFAIVSFAHIFVDDLHSAILLRGIAGLVGAPLGTLAFFYVLEILPPERRLTTGVALSTAGLQLALPISRIVSPDLLEIGLWPALNLLELALSLICLAIVFLLPITPPPRAQVFDRVDAISLPLVAVGLGLVSIALSLGRYEWWTEAPWIGLCLAAGIATLAVVAAIELNRSNPVLNLHFLSSGSMVIFAGSMLMSRFVLAEQSIGTVGFFQNLGFLNEHMRGLFLVILAASAAGFVLMAIINRPERAAAIHAVALSMIALGAWMESHATSLTRPHDVYLAQALVAFGGAIFLPAAMSWSLTHVFRSGPQYLISYLAVFIASQNLGSLLGTAGLGTLVTLREKFHSSHIVENLTRDDPLVAARIARQGEAYAHVLGDPVLRQAEGAIALAQAATREAYVLAYNDLFLFVSAVTLGALAILLLHSLAQRLRRPDAPQVPGQ